VLDLKLYTVADDEHASYDLAGSIKSGEVLVDVCLFACLLACLPVCLSGCWCSRLSL